MNDFYVYGYLDPRKKGKFIYEDLIFEYEPFYIGKGKNDRINEHCQNFHLEKDTNKHKVNKIKKIINEKLDIIKIKIYEDINEDDAFEKENYLIDLIGRIDIGTGTLVNLTNGGEGSSGRITSEYTKSKISESVSNLELWVGDKNPACSDEHKEMMSTLLKGRVVSDETKRKMSESSKGKKHTDETKLKISKAVSARILTDDTKNKISEGNKNKVRSVSAKCRVAFGHLKDIDKIDKYISDIEYIKLNIEEKSSDIMKNVNVERTIINKIKNNKHWSNEITLDEMKIIRNEYE